MVAGLPGAGKGRFRGLGASPARVAAPRLVRDGLASQNQPAEALLHRGRAGLVVVRGRVCGSCEALWAVARRFRRSTPAAKTKGVRPEREVSQRFRSNDGPA
jgi:hypothetical protein